ncbi:cobalt-precorrin 5A hydrolase [Methanobacterium oryzae]|uniref:cobalt-precorrin 5A hydrolase n=1 Tax=Methanobacterium oryzae TaxID=69540 RepID=UPI003D1C9E94
MKIAIITITREAQNIASNLKDVLGYDPTIFTVDIFHKDVKDTLKNIFGEYDCIIGIMATGIMVRSICTYIKDKIHDPAVLVMDDNGKYVISLLSGHLGGANDIAVKIAGFIGARPVITTATDTHGKIGIDTLARKYHLRIDDPKMIKFINSALVNGEVPDLYVPKKFSFIFNDPLVRNSYNKFESPNNDIQISFDDKKLILKSKKIVLGIGARKNISTNKVQNAIKKAMDILNLPIERIDTISTAEIKKDETGIIESAEDLQIPLEIIPLDRLKEFKDPLCSVSPLVMEKFNIIGVCEPSALIAAGENSKLIFKKTAFDGVTIAIAVS